MRFILVLPLLFCSMIQTYAYNYQSSNSNSEKNPFTAIEQPPNLGLFGAQSWNVVDPNSVSPAGDEPTQPSTDPFDFPDEDIGSSTSSW